MTKCILKTRAAGTIFVLTGCLGNLLKHAWEETGRKAKAALISKLTLSFEVQIECVHLAGKANCRQADGSNASPKRPSLLSVVWKT